MGNMCQTQVPEVTMVASGNQPTSKIRLEYFAFHGRADPIRMILKHKNIPFEDIHVAKEAWAIRKDTPAAGEFNCLPILHINGT